MKRQRAVTLLATTALATASFALVRPAVAQEPSAADSARMETGRTYTRWFYEGKTDSLFAVLTPEMRQKVFPNADKLAEFGQAVRQVMGTETEVVSEAAAEREGFLVYTRVAAGSNGDLRLHVVWVTDADGRVAGLSAQPYFNAAPPRVPDYTTKTVLRLPFDGEWYVGWGGRTREQNYHMEYPEQRFALDLLVQREGRSHAGDGKRLEDYYCWAQSILAPGDGTVIDVVDGLADQVPPARDTRNPAGNHVILDHGNGEFSLLAHLRNGSVAVRKGDRVTPGQKVGECGNSGNTSEPHLHYQLQNSPDVGRAEGILAQFQSYIADGRPVARGEPVRGQTIRPARHEKSFCPPEESSKDGFRIRRRERRVAPIPGGGKEPRLVLEEVRRLVEPDFPPAEAWLGRGGGQPAHILHRVENTEPG